MTREKHGQAAYLEDAIKREFLGWVETTSDPIRNQVMTRLCFECGLRAIEAASVRWRMAFDRDGRLRSRLLLEARATKGGYGARELDIAPDGLGKWLIRLRERYAPEPWRYVLTFRKGSIDRVHRSAAVQHFFRVGFDWIKCYEASSHSGRRTAITRIYRKLGIKEAQTFAGHKNAAMTARYAEPDRDAMRRLVIEQLVVDGPRLVMAKASLHNREVQRTGTQRKSGTVA